MFEWGSTYRRVYSDEEPPFDGKKPIPLTCPICGAHTDAAVAGKVVTPSGKYVRLPTLEMQVYNFLVRCTRCQSGLLVVWSWGPDQMGHVTGAGNTAGVYVYPPPTSAVQSEQLPKDVIPAAVFEDLRQAELAYLAGADYGAGLLLRRACQNICRHQNITETGTKLRGQITEMANRGIITQHLAEMAHGVRIIGNELAHPDPNTPFVITGNDVRLACEFLDQVVRAVYVDPARAKKLKEDLKQRGVT